MPGTFLDTSAFAKLYIAESGSEEIGDLVQKAQPLVVSAIVFPETLSALRRLVREDQIAANDYDYIKERLSGDIATIEVVSVSDEVIREAVEAIERSPIRTLDALHIGAALAAGASLFVTSDARQAEAARTARLEVRFIE